MKFDTGETIQHFCFLVWRPEGPNSSNISEVLMGGCITQPHRAGVQSDCAQNVCKGKYRTSNLKKQVIFCCCNTSHCNHHYTLDQKQTVSAATEDNITSGEESLQIYILGCVGLLAIIMILVLTGGLLGQQRQTH